MIAEAIETIRQMTKQTNNLPLIETLKLSDGNDHLFKIAATAEGRELGASIKPPAPACLKVNTLTGFVDAIQAGVAGQIEKDRIIHVENYLNVHVRMAASDLHGDRHTLLTATHVPIDAFRFDEYYADPEKFIIGLQVAFLPTENTLKLIKLVSALKTGTGIETADDGFNQRVTVRTGEVSTADVTVEPRIKLVPLTTFPEAAAVEREFLIRLKNCNGAPGIALFAVDGTRWKGESMLAIKKYLRQVLGDKVPILA